VHSVGAGGSPGQLPAADPTGTSSVAALDGGEAAAGDLTPDNPSDGSGTGLAGAGLGLVGAGVVDAAAVDMALARTPGGGMPATTGGVAGASSAVPEGVIGGDNRTGGPGGRAATGLGRTGSGADAHAAGSGGRGQEDEPDEHLTWLTEDDMVWGGDEPAAPSVLGGAKDGASDDGADAQPAGKD
jgi:hypothetical protein